MLNRTCARGSRYFALVGLVFYLFPARIYAFSGTEAASFLDLPVGARPAAMGSAYAALATDAYAPTFNPAGLGFLASPEVSGMYVPFLVDTSYEYGSFVYPLAPGYSLGAAVQYFMPGNLTGTDVNDNPIGSIGGYYAAYSLSYGQKLGDYVSVGATGKMIQGQIDDVSASAFAADFGTLVRVNDRLSLAATLDNLGQKMTFLQQDDALPLAEHLGAAFKLFHPLTISVEGVHRNYGMNSFAAGWEWMNNEGFSIRGGYNSDRTDQLNGFAGLSLGVGLRVWGQEFSYAWIPFGDLGSAHYFAIVVKFGQHSERSEHDVLMQDAEFDSDYSLMNKMLEDGNDSHDLNKELGN